MDDEQQIDECGSIMNPGRDTMRKVTMTVAFAVGATLMASSAYAQKEVSLTVAAGQPLRAMRPLAMVNSFYVPEVTKRALAAGMTRSLAGGPISSSGWRALCTG
jgi:hypothetical protein